MAIDPVVGVLLTEYLTGLRDMGLAVAAGVTLYVAASNLVPEFQAKLGWRMPISFFAGCGLYFAARAMVSLP